MTRANQTQAFINRLAQVIEREFSDMPMPDVMLALEVFKHNTITESSNHLARQEKDYISRYGQPSSN